MNEKKCKVLAAEIRLETLKVIHSRGFGHVGGSMDLADLMAGWSCPRATRAPWLTPLLA